MAVYVLTAVLVAILAIASLAAFVLGVLGAFGVLHLARCAKCGHLVIGDKLPVGCPYCRHPHLAHPITAIHRPHQPRTR